MDKERFFPPGALNIDDSATSGDLPQKETATSSVSSLIRHNQDLASRLNVAIGRNIELEKTIERFKKAHAQYEEKFQAARDQISIHREKEKYAHKESHGLKEKIQNLQAHLSYERKETQELKDKLENELQMLRPVANEYKKLKARIEKEYLPERDLLKGRLSEEESRSLRLEKEKTELLKKLSEASSHIKQISEDFKNTREKAKQNHLLEIQKIKQKLDEVQNENIVLYDRNRSLRKEQIEHTELINRIEEVKKEKELNLYQYQEEKDRLLLQISQHKKEGDRIKIENHDLKKQWSKTQTELRKLKETNVQSETELSSIRSLWQEKSSKIDQLEGLQTNNKVQIEELEEKLSHISSTHNESRQRIRFFFEQLDRMMEKQTERDQKATEAMKRAFKKAIEPLLDFDYNL